MMHLFSLWLFGTIIILAVFSGLDSAFGTVSDAGFTDAAFISFVALWCRQQGIIRMIHVRVAKDVVTEHFEDEKK